MAEKIDHDDEEKDEKDEAAEADEAKEKAALAEEKAAAADEAAEKDDADGDDDSDDDEEEEAKPAPKPVAKAAAAKPVVAKRVAAPLAKGRPVAARKGGSLGKSMILFVVIVAGLAAAFALLGQESSTGPAAPKWKTGDTPELEITLIADDKKNLACAAPDAIEGKHCAFEAQAKPWSKGDSTDDKTLLKPYTTVDHVQVLAAGLWSDPALTGTLPATRFSVKCKFKVEGKMKTTSMRWNIDGGWNDVKDLHAGSLSGCKLVQ
jgi:hypothetical protein